MNLFTCDADSDYAVGRTKWVVVFWDKVFGYRLEPSESLIMFNSSEVPNNKTASLGLSLVVPKEML